MINVYLAGKISKNGWREDIAGYRCERRQLTKELNYIGPYFIANDHGSFHRSGSHGLGIGLYASYSLGAGALVDVNGNEREFYDGMKRWEVVHHCINVWLSQADVMFVWLDALDAYGTIAEIGYAQGKGIPVFIATPTTMDASALNEMWFPIQMAKKHVSVQDHKEGWQAFLKWTKNAKITSRKEVIEQEKIEKKIKKEKEEEERQDALLKKAICACPDCGKIVIKKIRAYECTNKACSFTIARDAVAQFGKSDLYENEVKELILNGETKASVQLYSRSKNKHYRARLKLEEGEVKVIFNIYNNQNNENQSN